MSEKTRREFLKSGALGIAGLTLGGSFLAACGGGSDGGGDGGETAADTSAPPADTGATETVAGGGGTSGESIKVGLVNALTGVLSVTEKSIYQGGKLAVDEINAAGGIQGRQIEAITEDYASDFTIAVQKAQKLVLEDEVAIVIGGYTSASRVSMIPVFEQNNALLFYGTYYEGLECSPNCFYGGAVPNQFLTDYVPWVMENLGTKFYIVGSDYIYPRTVSAIVQKLVTEAGGEIVSDKYFALGTTEFGPTVADIEAQSPTVLFSNMVGDSTIAFYKQFRNAGFTPDTLPIAATVTTEVEVQAMGVEFAEGNYMTATYFQTLDNPANQDFVAAYQAEYGADAVTHMPLAGTYQSVYLFADAADRIITDGGDVYDTDTLKKYLVGAQFENAPEGITINVLDNHHCNHPSYVGQTNADGQFDIVATFDTSDADPFPPEIVPPDRAPVCPVPLSETSG